MVWELRVGAGRLGRQLLPFIGMLMLTACAQSSPRVPGDHSRSLMTGSRAERNASIARVMADESDRVQQINMQGLSLEIALEYLTNHLKIDARVDWEGLEAQGISRDNAKTTLVLFDATYADALRAILWQLRPREGSIGYTVQGGKLLIGPRRGFATRETEAQKRVDGQIRQKLLGIPQVPASLLEAGPAARQFYALAFANKMSIVMDWDELERVGVKPDVLVSVESGDFTAGACLPPLACRPRSPPPYRWSAP